MTDATLIQTVLFDLDGTLADTAPDLAIAVNKLLERYQRPALPFLAIRNRVSKGSFALTELAFGADSTPEQLLAYQAELLDLYSQAACVHSRLFPGVAELLATLDENKVRWGIVTNKLGWLSKPIVQQLGLLERSACLVSGDSAKRCKPHPDTILHACELLDVKPKNCVYVGDDQRDVTASKAAGMPGLVVSYGYIEPDDDPNTWGATAVFAEPMALWPWLATKLAI